MNLLHRICLALAFISLTSGLSYASEVTLPVKVDVRKSMTSNTGLVAQFSNTSDKSLVVRAEFFRAKGDAHKAFTFTLTAKGWKEIGSAQGWKVLSGDKITISSDGYTDVHCHLP